MGEQNYSRWFTTWPSTHRLAGQTVEVTSVSDSPLSQADLEEALKQALDKLMMVGVGYRARPMPVEDYELVEAAISILRALAGSAGEPDGGEGAEDE